MVSAGRGSAVASNGDQNTTPCSQVILDGCYQRYPSRGTTPLRYQLRLFESHFTFQARGKSTTVSMDDVIGCHVMRMGGSTTAGLAPPSPPSGSASATEATATARTTTATATTASKPTSGSSSSYSTATSSKSRVAAGADSAFFCIYAYHLAQRKGGGSSGLARQRQTYVFEVDVCASYANNLRVARRWQSAILWLLRGHRFQFNPETGDAIVPESLPAQRRYLCFVNPKSGPGRSVEIFLERVQPVLSEADISYLLLVTGRFNHAREFVRDLELDQWSGILIISGDGLLHEVYNGLMERPDADLAIRLPVGIIPGGSGNGLARSICHASGEPYLVDPVLACTFGCVRGREHPLDLFRIEIAGRQPIYSFLSFGWGMMSDIDIESEKLRSIGEIRFTLWALWRILNLRTYSGRISYLPATAGQRAIAGSEKGPTVGGDGARTSSVAFTESTTTTTPNGEVRCPPGNNNCRPSKMASPSSDQAPAIRPPPPPPPPPPTTSFTFGNTQRPNRGPETGRTVGNIGSNARENDNNKNEDGNSDDDDDDNNAAISRRQLRNGARKPRSQNFIESAEQCEVNVALERVGDDGVGRCSNSAGHDRPHVTVVKIRHSADSGGGITAGKNSGFNGSRSNSESDNHHKSDTNNNNHHVNSSKNGLNTSVGNNDDTSTNDSANDSSRTGYRAPKKQAADSSAENIYLEPRDVFPGIDDPLPDSWKVEEGRFVIIYSALVSHLGTKLYFAPEAQLNDGVCWLMLIKGEASRRQIASYFINQEVGKHVDLPWVRLFPVKAFRLESFDDSIMTIDGEIAETNVVQVQVLPGKARILGGV